MAAWRIGRARARCVVIRGLVGQAKRRGGGIALALGGDEAPSAGAALDHVVGPGDLEGSTYVRADDGEVGGCVCRPAELCVRRLREHDAERDEDGL